MLVIVTGILGAVGARYIFDAMKLRDPAIRGFAIGVASHGIGTARAFQVSEVAGTFAGIGMAVSTVAASVLVPLLAQMGERLDVLMLSHRDSDHTGGAAAVLAMQAQAHLWSSLEDEHPLHALRPGWTRCQTGQSWVWDGVLFEVLHPPATRAVQPGDPASKQPKPNEVSCVLRISNGQASVLLTGDIETAQELALVQAGVAPVDVLLVPHHGSKTSSSLSFLQTLHPRLALVQAGYRNRYGHPAPPVADRYRAEDIALVESTRCGAATWRSDAPAQVQCERVLARRYWHHLVGP